MKLDSLEVEGTFGLAILIVYFLSAMYFPLLKIRLVHQTSAAVVLGVFSGLIVRTVIFNQLLGVDVEFNNSFFFYFVLPPIIFTEGYMMHHKRFFQNISYISLFGILGTLVTFIVNSFGAYLITDNKWTYDLDGKVVNLSTRGMLLLGAVLSASDTVAACSLIEESDSPKINSILLGAGVVNDALSIILFRSAADTNVNFLEVSEIALFGAEFIYQILASIAIGVGFGVLSALMTKHISKFEEYPSYETALLFFLAYIGYFIAEMLSISGVISIMCSGIVMGHYTWYNLSTEAQIVSRAGFTIIAELLVAFVFVYVGFSTYSLYGKRVSYSLIGLMILVLMCGRFLGIVIIPGMLKVLLRRRFDMKWRELTAVWFAGCIRGAIAFALIRSIPVTKHYDKNDDLMLLETTIVGIVLFTTIVFGSAMPIIKKAVLTLGASYIGHSQIMEALLTPFSRQRSIYNDSMSSIDMSTQTPHFKPNIDNRYLKRWLMKSDAIMKQSICAAETMADAETQTSEPDFLLSTVEPL